MIFAGRMFIVGLFLGPFNHFWYGLLDRVIKGSGGKVVLKKILCDQTVAAPVFCSSFFLGKFNKLYFVVTFYLFDIRVCECKQIAKSQLSVYIYLNCKSFFLAILVA